MKILHLDIETAPNTVHVWQLRNVDVSLGQMLDSATTLCWAAKWDKKPGVMFSSVHQATRKKMVKEIYALVNEADAIVHFYGTKFDMPRLNTEFLLQGLNRPSPYKNIDLHKVCKKFGWPSYKLDYIVKRLGIGGKIHHKGHQLWVDCLKGDGVTEKEYQAAWRMMKRYNIHDVRLTEKLYHKLIGWIPSHPNHNVYNDDGRPVCVECGSSRVHKKQLRFVYTTAQKYQRYWCAEPGCGAWMRGPKTALSAETKKSRLVAAN